MNALQDAFMKYRMLLCALGSSACGVGGGWVLHKLTGPDSDLPGISIDKIPFAVRATVIARKDAPPITNGPGAGLGSDGRPILYVTLKNVSRSDVFVPVSMYEASPNGIWLVNDGNGNPVGVYPYNAMTREENPTLRLRPNERYTFVSDWPSAPALDSTVRYFRPGRYKLRCADFQSNELAFELLQDGKIEVRE